MAVVVTAAVEGLIDEAVIGRLLQETGHTLGAVYGRQGKNHLRRQIAGYNRAANLSPWLVLVDLDTEADCAPVLVSGWLPDVAPHMLMRVAVRSSCRVIREGMVPGPESHRAVGPAYDSLMIRFIKDNWAPLKASDRCHSLARTIRRLQLLA